MKESYWESLLRGSLDGTNDGTFEGGKKALM